MPTTGKRCDSPSSTEHLLGPSRFVCRKTPRSSQALSPPSPSLDQLLKLHPKPQSLLLTFCWSSNCSCSRCHTRVGHHHTMPRPPLVFLTFLSSSLAYTKPVGALWTRRLSSSAFTATRGGGIKGGNLPVCFASTTAAPEASVDNRCT